ncbi:MAG: hypothetical protein R3F49_08915 [Planctomycetota bacterium]
MSDRCPARAARWAAITAFGLALAARAPFALGPGFGADPDSWLLAESARDIAERGHWVPSRPPGYPLVEFGLAPLIRYGPTATNLASASWTALAAALGAAWLARRGVRHAWALPTAAAALPALALPAASTLDHGWALALLIGAVAALDGSPHSARRTPAGRPRRAHLVSGFLFGLACAARPPVAIAAPALLWQCRRAGAKHGVVAFAMGSLPGALCVAAAVARCTYWPKPLTGAGDWLGLRHVVQVAGPGAFGAVGLITVALLVVTADFALGGRAGRGRDALNAADAAPPPLTFAPAGGIAALSLAEFVAFPLEPNYLGPTLFFAALWLAPRVRPRLALAATLALHLGGLVSFDTRGPCAGPWRKDRWARRTQVEQIDEAVRALAAFADDRADRADRAVHVISGTSTAALRYSARGLRVTWHATLSEAERSTLRARGEEVLWLADLRAAPATGRPTQ